MPKKTSDGCRKEVRVSDDEVRIQRDEDKKVDGPQKSTTDRLRVGLIQVYGGECSSEGPGEVRMRRG